MRTFPIRRAAPALIVLAALAAASCATQSVRTVSSLYDYLYPTGAEVTLTPEPSALRPPFKLAVAWVPESESKGTMTVAGIPSTALDANRGGLSPERKQLLLQRLAERLAKRPFVAQAVVVPSNYLTPKGGFPNLQQVRAMYGVDAIALVSFDQVQFVDEGNSSFAYWTIIGAYMVEGEKNETSTMVDAAVFDIASRKLLFRAAGTSKVKSSATPINLSQELRDNRGVGFDQAVAAMADALDAELVKYEASLR